VRNKTKSQRRIAPDKLNRFLEPDQRRTRPFMKEEMTLEKWIHAQKEKAENQRYRKDIAVGTKRRLSTARGMPKGKQFSKI